MIGQLTSHLWQSTFFALAAGLLTLAFRGNRARVRYWLWLAASLKFLIPFALLVTLGGRLHLAPVAQKVATPVLSYAEYASSAVETMAQPFSGPLTAAPAAPHTVSRTPIFIFGLWLCGFVALALMRVRGWLRILGAVRSGTPIDIPASVEVRLSPGLLEPGVVGLARPVLLLPDGILERLTAPQLEAVIAHELCHVRRRDNLFAAVHMVVEALFWFHPLVWWIGARLLEERESACDEEVLTLGNQPRVYADAILGVCKLYVESPLACVSGVTGADIRKRVEAIMANRIGLGLNYAKRLVLICAGVAALVGPVGVGVLIGIGDVPVIQAQSPTVLPPITQISPPAASTSRTTAATPAAAAPAGTVPLEGRRLVALLINFANMTSDEQTRARQSAVDFVRNSMQTTDLVTVLASDNPVTVAQDFTADRAVLEDAIMHLKAAGSSSTDTGYSVIETVSRLLAAFPEKKTLMYYSAGLAQATSENQAELKSAIAAAAHANMAIFPVDVRGATPQTATLSPPQAVPAGAPVGQSGQFGGRGGRGGSIPAGIGADEYNRRVSYAQANYGSAASPMGRTYIQYGPPDQIEDRGSNGKSPATIWRYNYLDSFHSSVEFEFGTRSGETRINYPPPLAMFSGEPGNAAALAPLAENLSRTRQSGSTSTETGPITGLPGAHTSFQIYSAPEFSTLLVPLDSLSGAVDILAQIKKRGDDGSIGQMVANLMNGNTQRSTEPFQARFTLPAGSYVCSVLVRENATGRMYGETISFEIK
jgi:beta-lactamase regulating signal transducer with metallopeptidase domain